MLETDVPQWEIKANGIQTDERSLFGEILADPYNAFCQLPWLSWLHQSYSGHFLYFPGVHRKHENLCSVLLLKLLISAQVQPGSKYSAANANVGNP